MEKEIPDHMRGPKKSDDAHNHWNYGMTEKQVAEYLEKKRQRSRRKPPDLIAAE
jgi:hypothetical protein